MNPLRTAFIVLLVVIVAGIGVTFAGYGPFVDYLRPTEEVAQQTAPAPLQAAAVNPAMPAPAAAANVPKCKFCSKPCLSCPAPPVSEDITVEVNLANAEYNEKPGADLSK